MRIEERVAARHLARNQKPKIPVINKEKDRMVYVLPETAEADTATYEKVPADSEDHIKNHGKPRRPIRPAKPRRPKKPEIPRGTTPAPLRPARHPRPVLPVPHIKHDYIKPVPLVKKPDENNDPRKWKIRKPKPLQARVLERHLDRLAASALCAPP